MADLSGLSGVLGAAVAGITLNRLAARAKPAAEEKNGKKQLAYGTPVRVLGWVCTLLGLLIIYAATQASASQRMMAGVLEIGFILTLSYMLLEFHCVKIAFDDDFIYTRSPWRRSRKIPWTAISGYAYSNINQWHILKTNGYGKVRVSILLSGLGSLSEELGRRWLLAF